MTSKLQKNQNQNIEVGRRLGPPIASKNYFTMIINFKMFKRKERN